LNIQALQLHNPVILTPLVPNLILLKFHTLTYPAPAPTRQHFKLGVRVHFLSFLPQ
jgi:hypothetical protein